MRGGYKFDPAGLRLPCLATTHGRRLLLDRTLVLGGATREVFHRLLVAEMLGAPLPSSGLPLSSVVASLRTPDWHASDVICNAIVAP
jgi:hypothetical protein